MSIDYSKYKVNNYTAGKFGTCCCCANQRGVPWTGNIWGYTKTPYFTPAFINPFNFGSFNNWNLSNFAFFAMPDFTKMNFSFNNNFSLMLPAFPTIKIPTWLNSNINKTPLKLNYNIQSLSATNLTKDKMKAQVGNNDSRLSEKLKALNVQYNSTLGHGLATSVIDKSSGTTGHCAKAVNDAIVANNINISRDNHAYTRANILANDKENFTEVTISSKEELAQLPGGSIVVYGKGACGYSSEHGHVAIATGNGGLASDHIQSQIKFAPEANIRVFIPTKKITTA